MVSLTAQIIALGLGMILSPGLFAGTVYLLGNKVKPVAKSFAFLFGNIFTLLVLLLVGYLIGTQVNASHSVTASYFDVAFGFLLLFFAYKTWKFKGRDDGGEVKKEKNTPRLLLWFGIGFIASITNFDAETLYLISMNEIFESGSSAIKEISLALYSSLMILLPILLPIVFYIFFPRKSKKILAEINVFLRRYGKGIGVAMFVLLGAWFLYKGFHEFGLI